MFQYMSHTTVYADYDGMNVQMHGTFYCSSLGEANQPADGPRTLDDELMQNVPALSA